MIMNKNAVNFKKTFDTLGHGLMYRPTSLGGGIRIPGGPVQGFLASTGAGALGGYGVGSLANLWSGDDDEKKKSRAKRWALLGAIAAGLPAAVKSFGMAEGTVPQHGWFRGLVDVPQGGPETATSTRVKVGNSWMPMEVVPAVNRIASDNDMTPFAKALSIGMVLDANQNKPGPISFGQLAKAGIGAGLGVLGGTLMARVLSDMLGLPRAGTQTAMQYGGGLGGALTGAGFVR